MVTLNEILDAINTDCFQPSAVYQFVHTTSLNDNEYECLIDAAIENMLNQFCLTMILKCLKARVLG